MRVWVDGELLVDPSAPVLSVLDHGFTVGDGVFETLKVVRGRPFALTRHLDRLDTSAGGLGLPRPDRDAVLAGIDAVLTDEPYGRLRITYTAGPAPFGSSRGDGKPTLVTAVVPFEPTTRPARLVTVPWRRNERGATSGLKTTSYAENVVALAYARERGADEAIFANTTDQLCECTGSNLFCVLDGAIVTPPLRSGCLAGVTRALVIEWCGAIERDLPKDVTATVDEVFVTSSTRDIQPVGQIDDRQLAAPGPVTQQAMETFAAAMAHDIDPA